MKKTIIIIGAGKGLGNGTAERFGRENFRVILISRSKEHLKEYADYFTKNNIEVYTQASNVSDFEAFARDFKSVIAKYGTPDAVFYNVGVTAPDSECKIDAQAMMSRYALDVLGAYNVIQLIKTEEFSAQHGVILITGGGLALQPYAEYLPLSMDKAALRAMVQALHPVLKEQGIYLGTVQVTGVIGSNEHFSPRAIAEEFWKLYTERDKAESIY